MKLGLNIPNYGPGMGPDALLGWARFAEQSGFSLAMISDHVAVTPEVQALYPVPFYDPFTSIAWLAAHTQTLELGTSVTVLPYRDPIQTARITANIDQLSGGRFVFGVGTGWSREEYAALRVPFERRGAIADEYLAAIVQLWTSEVASAETGGEFTTFQDIHTGPAPARKPHPPVWVGGVSRAALRRVLRHGDAWHPINPHPSWLRDKGLPALRALADETGATVPPLCPRIRAHPMGTTPDERVLGEGTLDQIRADLEGLEELGAEYVVLDTYLSAAERRTAEEDWRILETVAALND